MISSILGLLVALGILVTVHEYGHFWVARKCGVKVLRFSVGFGQPIWRRTDKHGTEFVVAWIPLGGYVKMLDEREGEVPENQLDEAFTRKKPYQKIAIALAGPFANFIFAIVAFAMLNMIGVRDLVPIIETPPAASTAAEAQLQGGDKIISVDGRGVRTFTELNLALAGRVGDTGFIELAVERDGRRVTSQLEIDSWLATEQSPNLLRDLGISPQTPDLPAAIGRLEEGGAASLGGMQVGDEVVSVNSQPISDWMQWVEAVRASPNESLNIQVLRDGSYVNLTVTPASSSSDNGEIGYVGAAAQPFEWSEEQLITSRYAPWTAVVKGFGDTGEMVSLSYNMLWKMVTGVVSLNQIGGPISMAQMAGMSVESGLESFIGFLALISISLGIVNLLPVPVLDGGHVVMHSIEWLRGKEMSERAQMVGVQIGMMFIISLMLLAFFNDIGRIL